MKRSFRVTNAPGDPCPVQDGTVNPVPEIDLADLPPTLPDGAALLDVREDDEWAAGHAPTAVHIPMTDLAARLDDVPDGDPIYVICRAGGRSARVTQYLNAQGWEAVNVAGGMLQWAAAGRPLEAEPGVEPQII